MIKEDVKKALIIMKISIIALPLALMVITAIFFSKIPEQVPFMWSILGEPTNYTAFRGIIFVVPVAITIYSLIRLVIPNLDPNKEFYMKYSLTYYFQSLMQIVLLSAFYIIFYLSIVNTAGINIASLFKIIVCVMLIVVGNNLPRIKANNYVGITNPFTKASAKVWYRTHRFAGKLFFICGLVMLGFGFINNIVINVIYLTVVIIILIVPQVYSVKYYYLLAKENGLEKGGNHNVE